MQIEKILVGDVVVGARIRREPSQDAIDKVAESFKQVGQLQPIGIDMDDMGLIFGLHRLLAAKSLGWEEIDAIPVYGDEIDHRLTEIAENLHRSELTVLERSEHVAEWIRLTENKLAQVAPVSDKGGRGNKGGINAASRDLGVERTDAQRAVKIGGLTDEAKQAARDSGLDDNQSALLKAASSTPDQQKKAIEEFAKSKEGKKAILDAAKEIKGATLRGTTGTGENEWYTPPEHIEAARKVIGDFDLDPATSAAAQKIVKARRFHSIDDSGLTKEWHGAVWLNPPYAQPFVAQFVDKMVGEYEAGRVKSGIMLTHNYTDTAWFHQAAQVAAAICFTRGRVKFWSPQGEIAAPTQGQAFFYFGNNVPLFSSVFSDLGFVVAPCR